MGDNSADEPDLPGTACTPQNRITCDGCNDPLETQQDNVRNVRWGFWDAAAQNFDSAPRQEWYCAECWREQFKRDTAAHYEIEDGDQFWDILDAADGRLVADLSAIFVGGRPWIRVRNGELEGMRVRTRGHEESKVVSFDTVRFDPDKEWFNNTFSDVSSADEGGPPAIALLKPADETPFVDYRETSKDQSTLPEVTADDAE
ncbi:hypothetical protein [Salinibaculum rarum]|uniref:hypothetical protein n=1 Tax=Salinibaculum rarum TaxID=3058903 RepID=UPI00265F8795|nr:hypothetical protein [Salinibaculum sp. KK48]